MIWNLNWASLTECVAEELLLYGFVIRELKAGLGFPASCKLYLPNPNSKLKLTDWLVRLWNISAKNRPLFANHLRMVTTTTTTGPQLFTFRLWRDEDQEDEDGRKGGTEVELWSRCDCDCDLCYKALRLQESTGVLMGLNLWVEMGLCDNDDITQYCKNSWTEKSQDFPRCEIWALIRARFMI